MHIRKDRSRRRGASGSAGRAALDRRCVQLKSRGEQDGGSGGEQHGVDLGREHWIQHGNHDRVDGLLELKHNENYDQDDDDD